MFSRTIGVPACDFEIDTALGCMMLCLSGCGSTFAVGLNEGDVLEHGTFASDIGCYTSINVSRNEAASRSQYARRDE